MQFKSLVLLRGIQKNFFESIQIYLEVNNYLDIIRGEQ